MRLVLLFVVLGVSQSLFVHHGPHTPFFRGVSAPRVIFMKNEAKGFSFIKEKGLPCQLDARMKCTGFLRFCKGLFDCTSACLLDHFHTLRPACKAVNPCDADLTKHCLAVIDGQNRMLECLGAHKKELAPECKHMHLCLSDNGPDCKRVPDYRPQNRIFPFRRPWLLAPRPPPPPPPPPNASPPPPPPLFLPPPSMAETRANAMLHQEFQQEHFGLMRERNMLLAEKRQLDSARASLARERAELHSSEMKLADSWKSRAEELEQALHSKSSSSSSSSSSSNSSLACVGVCKGHSDSVESVAVSGSRFATGSWDSCIFLWDSSEVARLQAEQGAGKKQKTAAAVAGLSVGPAVCEMPEALLEGHSQCVSALVWPHPMALYSGSWDCSVRMWDTTTGSLSQTWHGKKQISGLSFSLAANLLASAHCDKVVALWDPRMGDGEAMKLQLRSHKAWVTDVNFAPDSAHLLASTSHDGSVKFWDTRASVPLHTISTHTDKVLSCCWYDGNTLLSGGSDCQLLSHTFNSS